MTPVSLPFAIVRWDCAGPYATPAAAFTRERVTTAGVGVAVAVASAPSHAAWGIAAWSAAGLPTCP